jgi:hypothetical protein
MRSFRQQLAYRVVASHGLAMFLLFAAPVQFFLMRLAKEDPSTAILAASLMVVGFIATLWSGPPWLPVSPARHTRPAPFLRWFRTFVGNGDAIQAVAKWIDPQWQNPFPQRRPEETERWLASLEQMHWATLMASAAPIAASFYSRHYGFGIAYIAANLIYNVLPNLLLRHTQQRLLRASARDKGGVVSSPKPGA